MKSSLKTKLIQHLIQKKEDGGFTLIELLVVVIIIGILAAIALPSFLNQANKARQAEAKTYVSSYNKGQQASLVEETAFEDDISELGVGIREVTEWYVYGSAETATTADSEYSDALAAGANVAAVGVAVVAAFDTNFQYAATFATPIGYNDIPSDLKGYGGYAWTELDNSGNTTTTAATCEGVKAVVPSDAASEEVADDPLTYTCAAPDGIGVVTLNGNAF